MRNLGPMPARDPHAPAGPAPHPPGAARDGRPLLVTSALPYANGPIHLGHLVGAYLPADLFVRFQRLRGADVLFICGTDEHGVAITVKAEQEGLPYRDYVTRWHEDIRATFERFGISFDHFSRTSNTDPHYALSQEFFLRLLRAGAIAPHGTQQHYCTTCVRFLPDRYVEGICYLCGGQARGDECKQCGSWLDAVKLLEPRCVTCRSTPQVRDTMQYELDLSPFSDRERLEREQPLFARWLVNAFRGGRIKPNVETMVFDKLLVEGDGLRARPITRDLRWGVPLPARDLDGKPIAGHEDKVLYVWFDAPIGYVSATVEWARQIAGVDDAWRRFWISPTSNDYSAPMESAGEITWPGPRLVHFIGKDNIPFHCVVFPAMLGWQGEARPGDDFLGPGKGERWVLPENVPANEFYNLEGGKFSTSDKRTVDNERLLERFGVDALRWYLTVSMPETADTQFRFAELARVVNAELADTVGNYASRVLKFVASKLDGRVPEPDEAFEHVIPVLGADGSVTSRAVVTVPEARRRCTAFFGPGSSAEPTLAWHLARYEFRRAAERFLAPARLGNLWFDAHAPWKSRKLDDLRDCRTALWAHLQILSALSVGMWPFMPGASDRLRRMLALPPLSAQVQVPRTAAVLPAGQPDLWRFEELPAGHVLGEPGILFAKIDPAVVEAERARLEAAT